MPPNAGVFVTFCTSHRASIERRRSFEPKRNERLMDAFHVNRHGPSIAPRRSLPYVGFPLASIGNANAPVSKKDWPFAVPTDPPQTLSFGFPICSARSEIPAPEPLSEAEPPRIAVSGDPVCQEKLFCSRQLPKIWFIHPLFNPRLASPNRRSKNKLTPTLCRTSNDERPHSAA